MVTPAYPPGPRAPALWQTLQFVARPKEYMRHVRARYGGVASFHTLLGRGVVVMDPLMAREVFAAPEGSFQPVDSLAGIFGRRAVIVSTGELHRRQRKLLNPPFHGARVKALYGTMQRVVAEHLERLAETKTGKVVSMIEITNEMTLDVILETVFGSALDRAEFERGGKVLSALIHDFSPSIIFNTKLQHRPFPPWMRFTRSRRNFENWVTGLIEQRRRTGNLGDDLLGLFLSSRFDDGAPMSDSEILEHMMTLLLAGHETSAIALAWATYWLVREKRVLTRLREEIAALGPMPPVESLIRQPYLSAVVSEALRIEPIVTDAVRQCAVPLKVGPWTVPAGQYVSVVMSAILTDPRVFPEPDRFRPERFLERKYHAGEFLPFGGGERRCLGSVFAEAELAIAVAAIAMGYDLELADARRERSVRRNLTMGPRHGVRLRVIGRRAPASGAEPGLSSQAS